MISVIVYGRNDSHGYNLPRRAALSLNCIAEILTDPNDEIIFVDYNTSNNYSTFIESIDDTLTEKAKKLLKVFRIPPEIHFLYKELTHLVVNESLARNIALRRSNPNNRWILSTNPDMIFIPKNDFFSLSDIAKKLDDGSYCTPRFELPEFLWETLDRKDPKNNIHTVNQWAKDFNLNFVVYRDPFVIYDAPGDFQLILRDQLFAINGFDESMLLGWHVDSNIAKRLWILNGKTSPLIDSVSGYHCMHTRTETNTHKHTAKSNDLNKYVFSIVDPDLPHQAGTWGLPNIEFELISFLPSKAYLNLEKFKKIVKSSDFEYYEFTTHNCWHNLTYPSERVLPYLTNILVTFPKNTTITYIGFNSNISNSTEKLLLDLEMNFFSFIGEQLLYQTDTLINDFYPKSNVLIFDFGFDLNHNDPQYHRFLKIASLFNNLVVRNSKESQNDLFKRKYFIAINTRENIFASLTELLIQFNQTPVGTFCIGGFPLQNINNPEIVELRKKELLQLENYFIAPLLHKDSFYYNLRDYELKTSNNCSKTPILYMSSFYYSSKREHLERLKHYSRIPIIYKDPSYYQYQLDQIIDFTKPYSKNINAGLDHNWSNISSNGIWTIGKNANMRLKLSKQLEQNLKIRIQLKPFTRPFYENQTLEVFVNNRSINKWEFKHMPVFFNKIKPNVWVEAIVPKAFVSNNKLKLSYKSSFTSKETDFGIRIQKILLSEINLNANIL